MKIPGFRSKTPWKMAVASFSYALILMVIIIAIIDPSSPTPTTPEPEHDAVTATFWAQEFVKQSLKSPDSAKFPSVSKAIDLGDGRYFYDAYVDSQNSFGASVRTNFQCWVKYVGPQKWECENLKFN
jgi:hypothetical protein